MSHLLNRTSCNRTPIGIAYRLKRLQRFGPNHLADRKKESGFRAFLRQYKDFMQIVLLAAAIISLIFTQELGTSLLLFGLTIFNAVLGLHPNVFGHFSQKSKRLPRSLNCSLYCGYR